MLSTLARFGRWLMTGLITDRPVKNVCRFCADETHVHDVNTGQCITTWCECGR